MENCWDYTYACPNEFIKSLWLRTLFSHSTSIENPVSVTTLKFLSLPDLMFICIIFLELNLVILDSEYDPRSEMLLLIMFVHLSMKENFQRCFYYHSVYLIYCEGHCSYHNELLPVVTVSSRGSAHLATSPSCRRPLPPLCAHLWVATFFFWLHPLHNCKIEWMLNCSTWLRTSGQQCTMWKLT